MMCVASEPAMNEIIDPVVSSMSDIDPQIPLVKQELITLLEHLSSSPVISGVQVTRSLVLCVRFVNRCLSFCTFSFRHCAVWPSSIYDF